jgi:hypothetical protein
MVITKALYLFLAFVGICGCSTNDGTSATDNSAETPKVIVSLSEGSTMGSAFDAQYGAEASSLLKEGTISHGPDRISDGQLKTAWCEGKSDDGIGEWVEISALCSDTSPVSFTGIGVVTGYASKESTFVKNNRVAQAKITLTVAGETVNSGTVMFADTMSEQFVSLGDYSCAPGDDVSARLEIVAVHAGKKYRDTCISELAIYSKGDVKSAKPSKAGMVRGGDRCKINAWGHKKNTVVRSGPGKQHAEVGVLKATSDYLPSFEVKESQDGWLRIKNPVISDPDSGDNPYSMPKEGWISGSRAGTGTCYNVTLFEKPNVKSKKVVVLEGQYDIDVSKIYSCSGQWLRVKASSGGQSHKGWMPQKSQCLSQVTTCGC